MGLLTRGFGGCPLVQGCHRGCLFCGLAT